MSKVFMIAAMPSADYSAAQSAWDSYSADIRAMLRDVEIRFKAGCPEYTTSPTFDGVANKVFDGPIDADDLSAIEQHWPTMRLISLINEDGTWHTLSRNGFADYWTAVRRGSASVGLSSTATRHIPAGWTIQFDQMLDSTPMIIGVNTHGDLYSAGNRTSIGTWGTSYRFSIRESAFWSQVEESLGVYSMTSNATQNARWDLLTKFGGSQSMLVLGFGNSLYGTGFPTNEAYINAFVDYATYVCAQAAPYVGYFEIYNEPDLLSITAAQYVALQSAVYSALKPSYPNHQFLAPAQAYQTNSHNFIATFAAAGGFSYCDGFSYHAYLWNGTVPPLASGWNNGSAHLAHIETVIIPALESAGHSNFPIHITEFGWDQNDPTPSDDSTKAANITQFITGCKAISQIKSVWYYELTNELASPSSRGDGYGLLKSDLTENELSWAAFLNQLN